MPLTSALAALGEWLLSQGYSFVSVTPATHRRVNARTSASTASTLTDIFGWSRPFGASSLPASILSLLDDCGALLKHRSLYRSAVRYSSLEDKLYVHSAYPTEDENAVFFGPDTYRFAGLIRSVVAARPKIADASILDLGCGTGAGGLVACSASGARASLTMSDINTTALAYARANAQVAGVESSFVHSDLFEKIPGSFDVIVANPPYLPDAKARLYRDGGGQLGSGLSVRIARESVSHLAPRGSLILYTGSCIVAGRDLLRSELEHIAFNAGGHCVYRELDPDVFGEELDLPGYETVDRIAVVSFVLTMPKARNDAHSGLTHANALPG